MIGKTLSHYKVIEKIGQGGMGEVYRAEDTNLSREVAIKVLPEQFTKDPQRLARFEREAKLLASLNHPNIAAIYGFEEADDVRFLAMELVPGETLQERVAKGPVPVEEALEVCRQIAEGVEAAHEKGVIHRDLKPANVKVTPEGKVKILDFGLAKAFEEEAPVTDISQSPTLTEEMTRAGVILGTAAYMSPEQAKGKPVDKRADVFAFGAVLYELLTGKRAFDGETITETIAKVLESEPKWGLLPEKTPWTIRNLLRRCLTKDVHDRLDGIGNVRTEIKLALKEPTTVSPIGVTSATQPPRWKVAMPWSVALVIAISAGVGFWILTRPVPQPLKKFVITPSSSTALGNDVGNNVAISPDGTHVIYRVLGESGPPLLQLRSLDDFVDRMIPGTENVEFPFFSPDGQSIAFVAADKLQKISLTGGPTITLYEAATTYRGGSWDQEDTIVLAVERGLYRMSAAGGKAEQLAVVNVDQGEVGYHSPQILPGGAAVLFTIWLSSGNFQIGLLSLETGELKIVIEGGREARYAPTGHLVYARAVGGTLMAAPFDLARLEVAGDPVPILEGVRNTPYRAVDYAFSNDGTLVYVPGTGDSTYIPGTLVWVDRTGQEGEAITQEPLEFPRYPRLSPDGQRLTLTTGPGNQGDLWVYNLGGQPPYPLTLEGMNGRPVWTPDGKKVAFGSGATNALDLVWIPADGSTLEPEPLLESDPSVQFPEAWTPDGQELIFVQLDANGVNDIMAVSPNGGEPRLVVQTQHSASIPARGGVASLSPDGRWLAYVSGVTGSPEIWVRPYPGPGAPVRISPSGGLEPVWSRDGQELFYLEGNKMMAVKVASEQGLTSEPPLVLFEGNYIQTNRPSYDVGSDGRFLMIKAAEEEEGQQGQINVVLNWFEELKRLVPTN